MSAAWPKKAFDAAELQGLGPSLRNRLIWDWWCDDGTRRDLLAHWGDQVQTIPSRWPRQDDPAPPFTQPSPQGHRCLHLFLHRDSVNTVLRDAHRFSNQPYAALGGAGFMLAQDPPPPGGGPNWQAIQHRVVKAALGKYPLAELRLLAKRAVRQASLGTLTVERFDLAAWAEQAALRFLGQLAGFGFQDHALLEDCARATYRALHYLSFAQHFVSEPGCLPAGQQALARLSQRASALMTEYAELRRNPRAFEPAATACWPVGVQPWSELNLSGLGEPLLQKFAALDGPLSGRDLATIAACLVAGTAGNLVNAACDLGPWVVDEALTLRDQPPSDDDLEQTVRERLQARPPIRVVPRRVRGDTVVLQGVTLRDDDDILLLLRDDAANQSSCPHAWGQTQQGDAVHACLGDRLATVLLAALVRELAALPALRRVLDPLDGLPQGIEREWGLIANRLPLAHDRERRCGHHNLIVSMRVKAPMSENAAKLRRLIATGLPRIEHVLRDFGQVHFAWFEFSDDDSRLVLRTIYDGDFDGYLSFFAQRAGDLFDHLFDYLEDAPPRPVRQHPLEFIDTIRRHNRTPLAGYLFSRTP